MDKDLYCIGCGIKLQCEDSLKEGYVDPKALTRDFILCKRCYQLKHYGKFVKSEKVKNTIDLLSLSASKDDLIILICDVALLYSPLLKVLKELNSYKNVILVANRYDLYSKYISIDKAKQFLSREVKRALLNINEIFIINDNINEIFDYIDNNSIDKNAYLIGLENAGKTTFVNKVLHDVVHEDVNFLTNSKYPGTTIDLVKIPLDDTHYFIDSPGIKSKGNLLNYVETSFIKNLQADNKIIPTGFQINSEQSLIVSNLIKLDYLEGNKQSIIFYGSSRLEITRSKLIKSNDTFNNIISSLHLKTDIVKDIKDLEKQTFTIISDNKTDIVIEGLGFFTVNKGKYTLYTLKGVNVFTRKAMI